MKKSISFLLVFILAVMAAFTPVEDDTIYLDTGTYGIIDPGKKKVVVRGHAKVQNLNTNGGTHITVLQGAFMELSGSYNQNGKDQLFVYGKMTANNFEQQNGNNEFVVHGEFRAGVGQKNDCSSIFKVFGEVYFTQFQANCDVIEVDDCAKFETGHLDINKPKPFKGSGFLKVKNSMNANHKIGHNGLNFYYPHHLNNNPAEGLNKVSEDYKCTTLNVVWGSVKFEAGYIEFSVTEPETMAGVIIERSLNGEDWEMIKSISDVKQHNRIKL